MDRKRELLVVIITAEEKEKKEQKGVAKTTPHTHKKKNPICESESHSVMSDSATPWTLQPMEFSRPEYWSEQPFPSPGNLPSPGI